MLRQIFASFDTEGICVYQAFKPSIADEALRRGTFGKGFNLERMTWIKPSFGWMLYRSDYATARRQERILKIKLTHKGFETILSRGIPTSHDPQLFTTEREWQQALQQGEVRYQWEERSRFVPATVGGPRPAIGNSGQRRSGIRQ